jgi:hypothetical protein
MTLDTNASSDAEAVKEDRRSWIPPWMSAISRPKWLFVLFAAACPVLWAFFFYFNDGVWSWFFYLGLFCLLPLGCFLFWELVRRQWKAVAILTSAITWMLFAYPILGPDEPLRWLRIVGFRVHVFPLESYLANCRLQEFVDAGKVQKLGPCQGVGDPGSSLNRVFYDSSRQLDRPHSERSEAWKQAMVRATDQDVVEARPVRTLHLFGSFYEIDAYF